MFLLEAKLKFEQDFVVFQELTKYLSMNLSRFFFCRRKQRSKLHKQTIVMKELCIDLDIVLNKLGNFTKMGQVPGFPRKRRKD